MQREYVPGQHSYVIETPKDAPEGEKPVILVRCTFTAAGWIQSGRMKFESHAEALAKIMRSHGFEREFPTNYGMSNVIEYWTPPAAAAEAAPASSKKPVIKGGFDTGRPL